MKLTFKKEIVPVQNENDRCGAKFRPLIYRCLEKPDFTICAEGAEWIASQCLWWDHGTSLDLKSSTVGTEIAFELMGFSVKRPEVDCPTCNGKGKVVAVEGR